MTAQRAAQRLGLGDWKAACPAAAHIGQRAIGAGNLAVGGVIGSERGGAVRAQQADGRSGAVSATLARACAHGS